MTTAKLPELLPDDVAHTTAHPLVELIENQNRGVVHSGEDGLQGEHESRQLAATRYPGKRAGRFARISGEKELDLVDACFVERDTIVGRRRRCGAHGEPTWIRGT
jgi:hypothetical protein